jgi:hypothetical protein
MAPATAVDERPDYLLDDELYEQAESGMGRLFRRFDDTQLTRFMWVAGDDIPVYDRSGGRFWGLYKDEVIRKRRLMPVRHARCLGINEYPALVGTAEQVAAPGYLAPVEAEGFERSNSARVTRPAARRWPTRSWASTRTQPTAPRSSSTRSSWATTRKTSS